MILATSVALAGLALVVALLFAERSSPDHAGVTHDGSAGPADDTPGAHDPHDPHDRHDRHDPHDPHAAHPARDAPPPPAAIEELASARLPRAVMGYEPVAVRSALAAVATAYAELARVVDDDTVRDAWERARRPTAGGDSDGGSADAGTPDPERGGTAAHLGADGRTGHIGEARDEGADRDG